MDALALLVALVAIGAVTIVYWSLFRPDPHTGLVAWSVGGSGVESNVQPAVLIDQKRAQPPHSPGADMPAVRQQEWPTPNDQRREQVRAFPTLDAIDHALGPNHAPFATDLTAASLECLARELVDMYWSDIVWLTGRIDAACLAAVASALEGERAGLRVPDDSSTAA